MNSLNNLVLIRKLLEFAFLLVACLKRSTVVFYCSETSISTILQYSEKSYHFVYQISTRVLRAKIDNAMEKVLQDMTKGPDFFQMTKTLA